MTDAILNISTQGHIGIVELNKPPHNFFDQTLIASLADAWEAFEADKKIRVILLCANGKSFCAGADFADKSTREKKRSVKQTNPLYAEAVRLYGCTKPVVAAIEGAAIGGGLGVALTADFRITCPEAKFSANFNRLGFHPGFGLSFTLPHLIGKQHAAKLLYTGARIGGEQALQIGLVDEVVAQNEVRSHALALAQEIAISSPRAVQATRTTLRADFMDRVRLAVVRESEVQAVQMNTADLLEGVNAAKERRNPHFED